MYPTDVTCGVLQLAVSWQGEAEVFESTSIDGDYTSQSALTLQIPPQYKDRIGLCCTLLKDRVRKHQSGCVWRAA